MFISRCLYPQNNEAVESAISYIDSHIKETPFQVDEKIAKVARELFQKNLWKNQVVSNTAVAFGRAGLLGFATVLFLPYAVNFYVAVISAISIKVFFAIRNAEGYRLQAALDRESEDEKIRQISLGANIYQGVWPGVIFDLDGGRFGGEAAPEWGCIVKGSARSLCWHFALNGQLKALAYVLMLEENPEKRAKLATEAIVSSANIKTAQLLIDFGAKPEEHKRPFFLSISFGRDEVTKFLVDHGARIDGGIEDYKQRQADIDSGNINIDRYDYLQTPLEMMTGSYAWTDPYFAFERLRIDPSVYTDKKSAEELYHSLNKSGARVSLSYAEIIFGRLTTN